jgi:hypothetical protein
VTLLAHLCLHSEKRSLLVYLCLCTYACCTQKKDPCLRTYACIQKTQKEDLRRALSNPARAPAAFLQEPLS